MSINAYEQMATGVTDITSIALVTLEVIHNAFKSHSKTVRKFICRNKEWFEFTVLLMSLNS